MFDDSVGWLFDAQSFTRRTDCGPWEHWLMIINQCSNAIVALSFFIIPVYYFYLIRKKGKVIGYEGALWGTAFCIFFCGLAHVCNVISFYAAPYRLFTLVDFLTAVTGVYTAMFLIPFKVRHLVELPTPEELDNKNRELAEEVRRREAVQQGLARAIYVLEERLKQFEDELSRRTWLNEKQLDLQGLRHTLEVLRGHYNESMKV